MWDYILQFWNSLTEVVVSAGSYSVEWFQNVGNAVAGAIGNLFEFIIHSFSDIFLFGGWFFSTLSDFFTKLWLPINYIFAFLSGFVDSAFNTPEVQEIWSFDSEIIAIFETIPYWTTLTMVLGVGVIIIVSVAILKQFLRT